MASDSFNLSKWSWFEAEETEGHLVWWLWPLAGIISLSQHLSHVFIITNIWKHLPNVILKSFCAQLGSQTLPKAKQTQGIEYLDSFKTFSSKQKFQQALKSWSNFSLVLFGKGLEIHVTTFQNPCNNFDKKQQFNSTLFKVPGLFLFGKGIYM